MDLTPMTPEVESTKTAAPGFDPRVVRGDFPILSRTVRGGKPLAYLDNAATTQKPAVVLDALRTYYASYNSNVHRALHQLGEQATAAYEGARATVAAFINASGPRGVVFTRSATEGINLVARSWGGANLGPGDVIILTGMEHHSNLVPWQLLAAERGARLAFIPIQGDGTLDLEAYEALLTPAVKLVAVTQMSNILGTINPVKRMAEAAHRAGAKILVDGAQSVPHGGVDVRDLGCDFLVFSGHKMAGPTGIGVLVAREDLLEAMPPFLGGGEMIDKVTLESSTWAEIPHKFEAGTPNIAGAIGLAAAVDYVRAIGLDAIHRHEQALTAYALRRLGEVGGLRVLGAAPERGGVLSFVLDGVHPHDIAQFVDQEGVAVRAGHMCAQPLMRILGVPAVSRASFYLYTLEREVDQLVDALQATRRFFGHGT